MPQHAPAPSNRGYKRVHVNGGELAYPGRRYALVRLRIASFDDVRTVPRQSRLFWHVRFHVSRRPTRES
jgi:hypothetical protein